MAEWQIEPLKSGHDRTLFACGNASLDNFFQTLVSQYEKRRLGRTYVATEPDNKHAAGFYTVAAGSIDVACLPKAERKKLPKHLVPTIHLARLAVDTAYRGRGLGETLLFHALSTALELSEKVGAFAVDVWAKTDEARAFYTKYGFLALDDDALHLYVPMKTVASMFESH
jgi:ribosomal protein S18 acetylase RimI-like enzyme